MLLIDVGNSRIKWALAERVCSHLSISVDEYSPDNITKCLQCHFGGTRLRNVWVSCVAGANIEFEIARWFEQNWGITVNFARTSSYYAGVTNAYDQATSLGVDRWLAMLAAFDRYQRSICVIDCGTAITMDLVDLSGQHQGGLIMPGLRLMLRSLQMETAAIEGAQVKEALLASDTATAVGSGCLQLLRKGISSIYEDFCRQLGEDPVCVVTGGDGQLLATELKVYEYRKDLVLCGLHLMACHSEAS